MPRCAYWRLGGTLECWLGQDALTRGALALKDAGHSPAIFTKCHGTSQSGILKYYWCSSVICFSHIVLTNKMARCFVT